MALRDEVVHCFGWAVFWINAVQMLKRNGEWDGFWQAR